MLPDKETRDIQAYLDDTLPQTRRDKFEQRLQTDPAFKARFEELKPIIETIEDIQYENRIREIIGEIKSNESDGNITPIVGLMKGNSIAASRSKPLFWKFLLYGIAASLFLVIGIGWYDSTIYDRIYNSTYMPQPKYSGSNIDNCPDNNTLNLYYSANYKTFFEVIKKKPETSCFNYYKGLCYLEFHEYNNAKSYFLKGTTSNDTYIKQSSEWYLGLTYIKLNDIRNAKILFQKIINESEHQYSSTAKSILKELEEKPILFRLNF
jgi:hypothetical protein